MLNTIISKNNRFVLCCCEKQLQLLDLETLTRTYYDSDALFRVCAISEDNRYVVAGDFAGRVHLLKILEASL